VRGRSYPWGTVNIEDRQHCDFTALRTLLLSHHMQVSTVSGRRHGPIEAFVECRRLKGKNYVSSFLIEKENATTYGLCREDYLLEKDPQTINLWFCLCQLILKLEGLKDYNEYYCV
jgi:hypothetical protein